MSVNTPNLTGKFVCLSVPKCVSSEAVVMRSLPGTNDYWHEVDYYAPGVETFMLVEGFESVKDYFESLGYEGVQVLDD